MTYIQELVEGLERTLGVPRQQVEAIVSERLTLPYPWFDQTELWSFSRVPGIWGGSIGAPGAGNRAEIWLSNPVGSGVDTGCIEWQMYTASGVAAWELVYGRDAVVSAYALDPTENRDTRHSRDDPTATGTAPRQPATKVNLNDGGSATVAARLVCAFGVSTTPMRLGPFFLNEGWGLGLRPQTDNAEVRAQVKWMEVQRRR